MKEKLLTIAALIILTLTAFSGVGQLGFIGYDDPDYVSSNPMVQQGLTAQGVAWAFGNIHAERTYWHPITWLTHMLDCQLFGLNGGAHHWVSLLFHTANVILLFLLLANGTGAFWTSAVAAGLFAVHPLQVESVAWITERKNLVSTFFALLTLIAYFRYARERKALFYGLSLLVFALGLMSKPAVITLPFVMLLLDWWPLRRFQLGDPEGKFAPGKDKRIYGAILEKVPFLLLCAGSALVTISAHRDLGMLSQGTKPPAGMLFSNILLSYFEYVRKFIWPSDLAVFYPFPRQFPAGMIIGVALVLLIVSAMALLNWKRRSYFTVGWLWFVGVMIPMSGIVFVGIQAMADRFMYLPIIGLILIVCFGAREFFNKQKAGLKTGLMGAAVALFAFVAVARTQVSYWKSDLALFDHARQVTKDNYLAYNVVGGAYLRQGDYARAMTNLQASLEIQPNFTDVHLTLGHAMLYAGKFNEALNEFREALRLGSRFPQDLYVDIGATYEAMGNPTAALTNYTEAVRIDPAVPKGHLGLANMLLAVGRFKEAISELRLAAAQEPNSPEPIGRLAWLLATHANPAVRNGQEAVQLAEKACQMTNFKQPQVLNALAAAYAETGKFDLAVQTAQKALDAARANSDTNLAAMTETLLKLYQSGKPYREGTN